VSAVQPPADRRLELAWRRHRQWSVAAETAKTRLDRWRWCNLVLLVLAAAAGAMAAQPDLPTEVATGFAIAAAVLLAVAGLVQANALNKDQAARWTAARAASEALKAEVYRYLLRVAPYDGTRPADVLDSQTDAVQKRTAALLVDQQGAQADGTPLPTLRDTAQYVTDRAQNQADWHRKKIGEHLRRARSLRICQFAATAVGVVLSVLAGFVPGWHLTSWIAALATIAAAFGTQLAATQH